MNRPYIILKAAVSLDGYLDDISEVRRVFSDAQDRAAVEQLRAEVDAILVGAQTVRRDDPLLQLRMPEHISAREASGKKAQPRRVVVCGSGILPSSARIFSVGESVLLYTGAEQDVSAEVRRKAEVVQIKEPTIALGWVLADLKQRGISRLLIEGGSSIIGQCVSLGYFDQIRLAVAPEFVGQERAPRLIPVGIGLKGGTSLHLESVIAVGRMTVLTYSNRAPVNA